jgi:hypothetical protein
MRKVLAIAAITGLMLTVSSVADAGGYKGASAYTPPQLLKQGGAQDGYHGSSYYAPGQQMQMNGGPGYTDPNSGQVYPGATYYTPHSRMLRAN